jgi:hypothetical protein
MVDSLWLMIRTVCHEYWALSNKKPLPVNKNGRGSDIIKGCGEGLLYTLDFSV